MLPEGKLQRRQLARAAIVMAFLLVGLAAGTAAAFERPLLLPAWCVGIALLWAYSFPPLRMAYRGSGEIAQGLGLGGRVAADRVLCADGYPGDVPVAGPRAAVSCRVRGEHQHGPCPIGRRTRRATSRRGRCASGTRGRASTACSSWRSRCSPRRGSCPRTNRWVWAAIEAAPALVLLLNYRGISGADPEHRPACRRFVFLNGLALNLLLTGWCVALGLGLAEKL